MVFVTLATSAISVQVGTPAANAAAVSVVTTFHQPSETETAVGGSILLTASIDTTTGATGGTISFYSRQGQPAGSNGTLICTTATLVNGVGSCLFEPANAGGAWNITYVLGALWSNNQTQKTGGVLTYSTTMSSTIDFFVAGITFLSYSGAGGVNSLKYESTTAVKLSAQTNIKGKMVFKLNGETITATSTCRGEVTTDALGYKDCIFTPPALPALQRLTVDLYPDVATYGNKYPVLLGQNPTVRTLDSYYFPNGFTTPLGVITGENIDNGYKWYQSQYGVINVASTTDIKSQGYLNIDGIFYKLNRATQEAVVMAYDRFTETKTSTIDIPAYITPTLNQLSQTGKAGYASFANLTYTVKYIMSGAFSFPTIYADRIAAGTSYSGVTGVVPETITSILLPNTLAVIGNQAFSKNCFIREMKIPDSVTHIGVSAFGSMTRNTNGCNMPGVTGLETLTVGAGVTNIGNTAFLNIDDIKALTFRGSKPISLRNDKYPGKANDYDQWQSAHTYTAYGNWAPSADNDSGVCTEVFYRYNGSVGIASGAASAWAPWFDGCLAGLLREEILTSTIPRLVIADNPTLTSLRLNFAAPYNNGGAAIQDYKIEYTTNSGGSWTTAFNAATSLTNTITGLAQGTAYRFRVTARNSAGYSDPSTLSAAVSTLVPTVPSAPTIGVANAVSPNSMTVSFSGSADNGGAAIESYTVTSSPDSIKGYAIGSGSGIATLTGLRAGVTYTFTARAGNSMGLSTASSSVTKKVPLTPVLGTWPNISKYKSDAPFTLTPPSESYTAAGTFAYTSSNSGIVSISGDTVTVVQSGSAVITATFYPSDTATYFSGVTKTMTISVSAASNAITFGSISSRAVNSGSLNLTATALGGTVTYSSATSSSICAVTNGGAVSMFAPGTCVIKASTLGNANYGAATDVTQNLVITAAPPGAPTLTSVSVGGTDAGVSTSGYATLQFTANTENGGTITSYVITATPTTGSAITKTVTAGAGARTESITALSLGEAYTFTVTAYNGGTTGGGTSGASNAVVKTPAANPNAPTNLRVTSGDTTLTANWTPPVNLGGGSWDSYRVFIKRSSDASFSETPTAIINTQATSTYKFTGLTNGVAYDVKIWVKTTTFTTELLSNTAAVYLIPATVPSAPRLAISQTDSTTVVASWASNGDGGSALTGYTLTLSSGACSFSFVPGTTSYSCAVTGLTPGTTVTGSLVAINGVGSSAATSASVNYITAVGAPTSVVASNGDGQVKLTFSINIGGDSIVSFDYSLDGLSYSPLNATASPVTITGLTNDVSYSLYLRAKGATYGDGSSSVAIAVLPHLTIVVLPQVAPAPSYIKAVKYPTIVSKQNTYVCSRGEYQFARSGGGHEAFTSESAIYKLYINGALIDSASVQSSSHAFEKGELSQASTISCSVTIAQESVTNEFSSLTNPLFRNIEKSKKEAYSLTAGIYQIARDAAYSLRVEGDSASIEVWRKSMEIALTQRQSAEDVASAIYVKALEKEEISLFFAAPAVKKPVVTKPAEVIKTPDKTNVQPTSTMRKVGTIYFANGTYFINDASRRSIIAIASKINVASAKTVLSYGHTDSTGGVSNILLSKNRSKAVAALLRDALSGKKVVTGWYAATKPIATGTSKADLAKNRRVEIYIK